LTSHIISIILIVKGERKMKKEQTREERAAEAIRTEIGRLAKQARLYERAGNYGAAAHTKLQARRWNFYLVNLKTGWTVDDLLIHNGAEQRRLTERATALEDKYGGRVPAPGPDLDRWQIAVEDLWLESEIEKLLRREA
jgi:hypothetical protein